MATAPEDLSGAHIRGIAEASLEFSIRANDEQDREEVVIHRRDVKRAIEQVMTEDADIAGRAFA